MANGTSYQHEPLVTPAGWTGEERRFAIRLKQILDDLYRRSGAKAGTGEQTGEGVTTARTALKLKTARTICLKGSVNGEASFDGSADAEIQTVLETLSNEDLEALLPDGGAGTDIYTVLEALSNEELEGMLK